MNSDFRAVVLGMNDGWMNGLWIKKSKQLEEGDLPSSICLAIGFLMIWFDLISSERVSQDEDEYIQGENPIDYSPLLLCGESGDNLFADIHHQREKGWANLDFH